MDKDLLDFTVEQFTAQLNAGIDWYELDVSQLSTEQLLETVHRHVTMMHVHAAKPKLYYHHLEMLSTVADEVERRRLAFAYQNKG